MAILLPPAELEVTSKPEIVVCRTRTPADYVRTLSQLNVQDPRYLRSRLGTLCNRVTHDGCVVLGCPMPRRKDGWPMKANEQLDYWSASKDWQPMVWQDAMTSANLGYPTVFAYRGIEHGHVGWILPTRWAAHEGDLMTMQAGFQNWYGKELKFAFRKQDLEQVKFFGRA